MAELRDLFDSLTSAIVGADDLTAFQALRDTTIDAGFVTYTDGSFVLQPQLIARVDGRVVASIAVPQEMGAWLRASQGQLTAVADPVNGSIIATATGLEPVRAVPVLEGTLDGRLISLSGESLELGIDVRTMPPLERHFGTLAGGGACSARWQSTGQIFSLRVRALMPTPVIPLSSHHRRLLWRTSLYFALDPELGLMRITNNPEYRSYSELFSLAAEPDPSGAFFPARGFNSLHFKIEMVDLGMSAFNKAPMVQSYPTTQWPPYATPLSIDRPVQFFDTTDPDTCLMTILSNDMQLYDYASLTLDQGDTSVSPEGRLRTTWRITNHAPEEANIRWFLLGDQLSAGQLGSEGGAQLSGAGSSNSAVEVTAEVDLRASSLRQHLYMNAVSLGDPVLGGSAAFDLEYAGSTS